MLGNAPFYFSTIAKTTAAFGWIFSDIVVQRTNPNTSEVQSIKVPIELSTKEKWFQRVQTDPNLGTPGEQRPISLIEPRMGYAYKNFRYDSSRKMSSINFRVQPDGSSGSTATIFKQLNPIPVVIEYSLYVRTKTLEDGFQIVEQIGAFFGPDYVVPILDIPAMGIKRNIIFSLKGNSHSDSYEGQLLEKRVIEWQFDFEAKAHLYPPIRDKKLITEADIRILEATDILDSILEIKLDPPSAHPDDNFDSIVTSFHGNEAFIEQAAHLGPFVITTQNQSGVSRIG